MTYEERLAALGITQRGQLASGFKPDMLGISEFHESEYVNKDAGMRIKAPALNLDLSHLNDPRCVDSKKFGRRGGKKVHALGKGRDGGKHYWKLRKQG